jgi:arylsulfatase A-like enzyme
MNSIIIVVDRLHSGYLGCYGNAWIATPAIDRLAGESFLFDQALVDSPHLDHVCGSFWQGLNALAAIAPTTLLTDEPQVARHPLAGMFGQLVEVPAPRIRKAAEEVQQAQFARLLAAASNWLGEASEPFCLWLHSRGMSAAWDAPLEFRQRYADDEGPPLSKFVAPPHFRVAADADPDELLGIRWAYAGQVSLLDACLAEFLELIDTPELRSNTLLVLVSARGYPLGEHGWIGEGDRAGASADPPLHEELIHIPWLMRLPGGVGAAARSQALVQPADLPATLLSWWQAPATASAGGGLDLLPIVRDEAETVRDRVALRSGANERAIRTPAWHMRLSRAPTLAGDAVVRRLYAKPDDRWEMNEVSDRCGEVPDLLAQTLAEIEQAHQHGPPLSPPALPEVLLSGLE